MHHFVADKSCTKFCIFMCKNISLFAPLWLCVCFMSFNRFKIGFFLSVRIVIEYIDLMVTFICKIAFILRYKIAEQMELIYFYDISSMMRSLLTNGCFQLGKSSQWKSISYRMCFLPCGCFCVL